MRPDGNNARRLITNEAISASALYGPDEIAVKFQALRDLGAAYVLLNSAGARRLCAASPTRSGRPSPTPRRSGPPERRRHSGTPRSVASSSRNRVTASSRSWLAGAG
jgi:hypothetical protein